MRDTQVARYDILRLVASPSRHAGARKVCASFLNL